MIPVPSFSVSATWETTRAEAADFIEAIRPKWPRAFDITATFADGSREVRRVLLDAPDGTTCIGVLVSGPRMADGAWSRA